MTTPVSTQSSFTFGDRPLQIPINRNGQILAAASALPASSSQNWYPTTDNAYSLGRADKRWSDLFVAGTAYVGGQVLATYNVQSNQSVIALNGVVVGSGGLKPYGTTYPDLGLSTNPFNTAYINNINAQGRISSQNLVASTSLTVTGSAIFNAPIYPVPTATHDLGGSSNKWKTVYATDIDFSGQLLQNGVAWSPVVDLPSLSGTLLPSVTATYDIGETGNRWKDLWLSGAITSVTGNFTTLNVSGVSTLGVTGTGALTSTSANFSTGETTQLTPSGGTGTGVLGTTGLRFASAYINAILNPSYIATPSVVPFPLEVSDELGSGAKLGGFQQKFDDCYVGNVWSNIVQPFTNGTGNAKTVGTTVNLWTAMYTNLMHCTDFNLVKATSSTVGAAGGASALPATPTGYIVIKQNGIDVKVPYYNT